MAPMIRTSSGASVIGRPVAVAGSNAEVGAPGTSDVDCHHIEVLDDLLVRGREIRHAARHVCQFTKQARIAGHPDARIGTRDV